MHDKFNDFYYTQWRTPGFVKIIITKYLKKKIFCPT